MKNSMKTEQENFEELQRLLSMKRGQTPPPHYLRGFSEEVLSRLHEPEPVVTRPWWRHVLVALAESRPVQVSVLGLAVGGLLVAGLASSQSLEKSGGAATFRDRSSLLASQGTNTPVATLPPDADRPGAEIHASTEPVLGTNLPGFRFNTSHGSFSKANPLPSLV
jgi:hypothetical protein